MMAGEEGEKRFEDMSKKNGEDEDGASVKVFPLFSSTKRKKWERTCAFGGLSPFWEPYISITRTVGSASRSDSPNHTSHIVYMFSPDYFPIYSMRFVGILKDKKKRMIVTLILLFWNVKRWL